MTEQRRYCYVLDNGKSTFYDLNKKDILQMYQVEDLLNEQKKEIEYLEVKAKELKDENKQLKKDRFICLDCKYCGYTEIGCLCEKQDHWEDFKNKCNDFKELKY